MKTEIQEATEFLSSKVDFSPEIGMILGTGLGNLTDSMELFERIQYKDIPHFPLSTTQGHKGTLLFARSSGRSVMAMEGRFHIYEGYSLDEITFPIRLMTNLGVKYLFISSAAGGLNPQYAPGDIMIVTDHINLTGRNPLIGPNLDSFGPRFPDMTEVYDRDLINIAEKKALQAGIRLQKGVYIGITGPSLETPAETRFLRMIGADAVGMSTVSEVIAGVHCGLRISVIVAITNVNLPDCMGKTTIEDVIETANRSGIVLSELWSGIIESLPEH